MKSQDTISVREYLSAYKKEIILGSIATIATIAALGVGSAITANDSVKTCNSIESANSEVSNPDDLLSEYTLATGQYVKIHNLKSMVPIVYKSDAPYIADVFGMIGSSQYTDLRKPTISSIGHLVCVDTSSDVITYRLTQKAHTGANALIKAGVVNPALSELVNQE